MHTIGSLQTQIFNSGLKILFYFMVGQIHGCETLNMESQLYLLGKKKKLPISGPAQFKPVLLKGQLY